MIILAIDTSCDDTCIAILEIRLQPTPHPPERHLSKLEIKSNVVSSQVKIHRKYGGVYPSLAKREHQKNLPAVLKKALCLAKPSTIVVVTGKGSELWMCVAKGKKIPWDDRQIVREEFKKLHL